MTPSKLLGRYAPLIAVLAVQAMLIVSAPSGSSNTGANGGSSGLNSSSGAVSGDGGGGSGDLSGGGTLPGGGSLSGGGTSGGGTSGGGSNGGNGDGQANGPVGYKSSDRSKCDSHGIQKGVVTYMPPCQPVWHGGNNGGATMTGVTGNKVTYVYFVPQANAQVNAILARENLAATSEQICEALQAWNQELNKRYEFYGRKIVSLDGPGQNAGSKAQSSCHFPYFQSQCTLTPPDEKCLRAEADTIARMKPTFVIATADGSLVYRLAQDHIVTITGNLAPEQYYDQLRPYLYGATNGTLQARFFAEYWCKKLAGKRVQYAGTTPGDAGDPDHNPASPPPVRKLGISYYLNPGDHTAQVDAQYLQGLVTGGMCGAKGDAFTISYASDITTAQQQTNTYIAEMKKNGATDSTCFCDPIAPVFSSKGEEEQNYHPEQVGSGSGLLDYDPLAQLYDQDVWRHTFGLSNLGTAAPFSTSDAVKAWHDVGRSGEPDQTENLSLYFHELMGLMIQAAGPNLNLQSIHAGLLRTPELGGTPAYPGIKFQNPFPWSGQVDIREAYYCPTTTSKTNGQQGAYVPQLGGKRIKLGQFTNGLDGVFPNGLCAP